MAEYSDDTDIFGRQLGSWERYHIIGRYMRLYGKYVELCRGELWDGSSCATYLYWYPYLVNIELRLRLCHIETPEPTCTAPIHETIDAILKFGIDKQIAYDMDSALIYEIARLVRLAIMSINQFYHGEFERLEESCKNFAWG